MSVTKATWLIHENFALRTLEAMVADLRSRGGIDYTQLRIMTVAEDSKMYHGAKPITFADIPAEGLLFIDEQT